MLPSVAGGPANTGIEMCQLGPDSGLPVQVGADGLVHDPVSGAGGVQPVPNVPDSGTDQAVRGVRSDS